MQRTVPPLACGVPAKRKSVLKAIKCWQGSPTIQRLASASRKPPTLFFVQFSIDSGCVEICGGYSCLLFYLDWLAGVAVGVEAALNSKHHAAPTLE